MKIAGMILVLSLLAPAMAAAQAAPPRAAPAPALCAAPIGATCRPLAAPACSGHGQSLAGACACTPGWSGTNCEAPQVALVCSGHGEMVGGRCLCSTFWTGPDCGTAGLSLTGRVVGR